MHKILVGFYQVAGVGTVTVETPLTGVATQDYQNLFRELKKKFPKMKPGDAHRTGSTIESREDAAQYINPNPGMAIRQVFDGAPPKDTTGLEVFRNIGTVFHDGASQEVVLRYHADKGCVGITLIDRLTRNATRFSNQIDASISVMELPSLVASVLGDHKELKLRLQKHPEVVPVVPVVPTKVTKSLIAPTKTPVAK